MPLRNTRLARDEGAGSFSLKHSPGASLPRPELKHDWRCLSLEHGLLFSDGLGIVTICPVSNDSLLGFLPGPGFCAVFG